MKIVSAILIIFLLFLISCDCLTIKRNDNSRVILLDTGTNDLSNSKNNTLPDFIAYSLITNIDLTDSNYDYGFYYGTNITKYPNLMVVISDTNLVKFSIKVLTNHSKPVYYFIINQTNKTANSAPRLTVKTNNYLAK